jgi:hypothetical protein
MTTTQNDNFSLPGPYLLALPFSLSPFTFVNNALFAPKKIDIGLNRELFMVDP